MSKAEILLETGTNELEILELYIAEQGEEEGRAPSYFGVNVAKVMQVIESPELTAPESASHPSFLGTIALRDKIVPIIDLSILLGVAKKYQPHEVVIITEFSQTVTGLLVTGVTDIFRIGWKDVMPPEGYLSQMVSGSIIGIVEMKEHFVQLLDLESILAELDPTPIPQANVDEALPDRVYKALVADDSATIRLMLQKMLEAANFELTIVHNGDEARKKLSALKESCLAAGQAISENIDIVIADIEMPRMDGFSLTKFIKEDKLLKDLPVILYSSLITKELFHKGQAVQADDQVSKPEMGEMASRAIRLIHSKEQGRD